MRPGEQPLLLWADQHPWPTFPTGLRRERRNARVVLPLSGEERKGLGSGKRENQQLGSHRPQPGNPGPRGPSGPLRQPNQDQWVSQNPEQEERTELLGPHPALPHSPTQSLSCVASHLFQLPSHTA